MTLKIDLCRGDKRIQSSACGKPSPQMKVEYNGSLRQGRPRAQGACTRAEGCAAYLQRSTTVQAIWRCPATQSNRKDDGSFLSPLNGEKSSPQFLWYRRLKGSTIHPGITGRCNVPAMLRRAILSVEAKRTRCFTAAMSRIASCHCTKLRLVCSGEPVKVSLCHCLDCQRRTGSLFSVAAFFHREAVEQEPGPTRIFRRNSASGFDVSFHHCAECGSNVWWEPDRMPHLVGVAAGAFADPWFRMPEQAVWARDRHVWLTLPEQILSYECNPPPRSGGPVTPAHDIVTIAPFEDRQFAGVQDLWREAFPDDPQWNRAEDAIAEKRHTQPELFLVAERASQVVGTVMAGYDGHRGWLYSLAVRTDARREGLGSSLLSAAEQQLKLMGCRKINIQIRGGNEDVTRFYEKHGFIIEDRVSMGKRVSS